jgi:hypothetical protein
VNGLVSPTISLGHQRRIQLIDPSINEDEARLENANLAEAQQQEGGLRKKRQMEMGSQ